MVGFWMPRSLKAYGPTYVTLDVVAIRSSIMKVLSENLGILIRRNGHIRHEEIENLSNALAMDLTNGCMMMLYCRLRFLHILDAVTIDRFSRMPRIPENFEVPTPYAIAFQKLGVFRVRFLPTEVELVPIVTADHALNFGTQPLSLPMYEAAVKVVKNLGMRFNSLNHSVKLGSAWWMLKPIENGDSFQLQCCLPEDNYRYEDAAIRWLWCINSDDGLNNKIADLSAYPDCYGSMVRNPYPHVAVTYFMGIMDEPKDC